MPQSAETGMTHSPVAVMRQPIQQRRRHLGITEYTRPFREAQVRHDDHTGVLIQFR